MSIELTEPIRSCREGAATNVLAREVVEVNVSVRDVVEIRLFDEAFSG